MANVKTTNKRIQILTADEIKDLYQCPVFNQPERDEFFSLDEDLLNTIKPMEKLENKLYLILLIGYFRAKPVVPKFNLREVKADVKHICKKYFPHEKPKYTLLSKSTRSTLVNKMLNVLEFNKLTKKLEKNLTDRLSDVATICTDPRYIFDECLAFLGQEKISLPGYSKLQDLVTKALGKERSRTELILSKQMSDFTKQRLKHILNTKGVLNSLSVYKGSAKGFTPSEINQEIKTHDTIKDIYPELKNLIGKLKLSQGNLNYYSSIIHHSSLYKVRRHPEWQALLYLVCYLFFRYRETNDKLVTCFQYLTRKHDEAAKAYAKQRITDELETIRTKLKYAGNILYFFVDDNIKDTTTFGEVRDQAYKLVPKKDIELISLHLDENDFDKTEYQWQYTDKHYRKVSTLIRRVFLAIDIECESGQLAMKKQLEKTKCDLSLTGGIDSVDENIIYKPDRSYLIVDDEPNTKRFEYYLYHRVYRMLDNNRIYVTESAENKRLEDDLITPTDWKNKQDFINNTGLSRLNTPISDSLTELVSTLNNGMQNVSDGINTGVNEFVKRTARSNELSWSVATSRWKEEVENPIYNQAKHISIIDIMNYVNQESGYLKSFRNVSTRKHSVKALNEDLQAVIFANGSSQGILNISNASDRSIGTLRSVNEGYMNLESISAANDVVANQIAQMPIFKHYTINETAPFGSVDGQKHPCRINTFKARFSAKYFRKGKGVSVMTLVSNHVPLNTTVISPNEYEAHYAFDLLYNNSSEIKPMTLTSDNHGINNVNFAILDLFGYQFAPRYSKFKNAFLDQFEIISGEGISIELKEPINTKLIEQEWDEIQRIICSLSRKTTTQSTIIRKLSNNKKNNRTLAALHEYDRLIKCIYLLEYVDNKTLRQFVQQALNRGEAYHQLRKAIASLNGKQFRGGSDYQVAQWNDCARLIANCIIFYNCALLSYLVEKFEKEGNQRIVDMVTSLSPIAWRHIQLSGHYIFGGETAEIDVAQILETVDPLSEEWGGNLAA